MWAKLGLEINAQKPNYMRIKAPITSCYKSTSRILSIYIYIYLSNHAKYHKYAGKIIRLGKNSSQ